jgi:hypothetical protein
MYMISPLYIYFMPFVHNQNYHYLTRYYITWPVMVSYHGFGALSKLLFPKGWYAMSSQTPINTNLITAKFLQNHCYM